MDRFLLFCGRSNRFFFLWDLDDDTLFVEGLVVALLFLCSVVDLFVTVFLCFADDKRDFDAEINDVNVEISPINWLGFLFCAGRCAIGSSVLFTILLCVLLEK